MLTNRVSSSVLQVGHARHLCLSLRSVEERNSDMILFSDDLILLPLFSFCNL
jgi:GTP cyclohydrolase I